MQGAKGGTPMQRKQRSARPYPKGRQIDPRALESVRALLGDAPRRRDLLIEHLHRVQDAHGCISHANLAALASEMRLSLAEVFEVATFYAHFDIVGDDEAGSGRVTVRVCDSLTCEMMGSQDLKAELETSLGDRARVVSAPCMGRCQCAPTVEVGHRHVDNATAASVAAVLESGETAPEIADYQMLDAYEADGGYALLRDCYAHNNRDAAIETIAQSGLRGMGGAGFPGGQKWRIVGGQPAPRLMAVNADEGEPGTFKDRWVIETKPHQFLEGMLIAAWAVEADEIYIYLRDEYPGAYKILAQEIAKLEQAGLTSGRSIHLRRGAGAYICGEESAMLESIEGKRGLPRHKPPFPAEIGLFGRPTLIHNVETLYAVPPILKQGPEWYSGQGRHGRSGLRGFSVSGRVREPGVKIAPAGITAQELIDEFCGGVAEGHSFKGYLPGGASGGILPASMADIPLDFGTLEEHGCFVGSGAVVILSDQDNARDVALNLMRFFQYESCGQCTPCRVGTEKAVALMERPDWDTDLLAELSQVMRDASICGLGQAAPNPLQSAIKHFPEDIKAG